MDELMRPAVTSMISVPKHQNEVLSWHHEVHLVGEKCPNPRIHTCDSCHQPILIYGRLVRKLSHSCHTVNSKQGDCLNRFHVNMSIVWIVLKRTPRMCAASVVRGSFVLKSLDLEVSFDVEKKRVNERIWATEIYLLISNIVTPRNPNPDETDRPSNCSQAVSFCKYLQLNLLMYVTTNQYWQTFTENLDLQTYVVNKSSTAKSLNKGNPFSSNLWMTWKNAWSKRETRGGLCCVCSVSPSTQELVNCDVIELPSKDTVIIKSLTIMLVSI